MRYNNSFDISQICSTIKSIKSRATNLLYNQIHGIYSSRGPRLPPRSRRWHSATMVPARSGTAHCPPQRPPSCRGPTDTHTGQSCNDAPCQLQANGYATSMHRTSRN